MWIGAIIGAIVGVAFYALRSGGWFLKRDLQGGFGLVATQAIVHMIIPGLIGLAIGFILF